MKTFLHNMELRKLFPILTGIVLLLLAAISALGIKQYLLYRHCDEMLAHSNKIIFQFTSIKEHINDSLVAGTAINIPETSQELLSFDQDLKSIVDDILIPEEFKLSLVSQVDLMSLVVQLRTIMGSNAAPSPEQGAKLTASLRSISNRLHAFHNVLAGYTRSLLLGFYKVIVGTLALVIFFTTTMLLLINRFIAFPIVQLCSMAEDDGEDSGKSPWKASALPASIHSLTLMVTRGKAYEQRMQDLQTCLENTLQTLPDSFDTPDSWETLCAALQTNPNYILVWAGQFTGDGGVPEKIIGDGCVSCSPRQCRRTIEQLMEFCYQEGGLCDTAKKAAQQEIPVIAQMSHEEIPQPLRQALAMENVPVLSASFPITGPARTIDTVITLYCPQIEALDSLERSILQLLCEHIGHLRLERPSIPGLDQIPTDLYRFAVAGHLSTSLAHEIINLSNGALNYSQALVDLTASDQAKGEEHLLLEKLHGQEQKISRLATDFNQLVSQEASRPQKISIPLLFDRIQHLLQGKFRQHNIKLQTTIGQEVPEVIAPFTLLQIVLLTLLHEAETYMQTVSTLSGEKIIRLTATTGTIPPSELLLTVCPLLPDIETDLQTEAAPWPSISVCRDMMHSFEGDLILDMHATDPYQSATLTVPLQVKTTS